MPFQEKKKYIKYLPNGLFLSVDGKTSNKQ